MGTYTFKPVSFNLWVIYKGNEKVGTRARWHPGIVRDRPWMADEDEMRAIVKEMNDDTK